MSRPINRDDLIQITHYQQSDCGDPNCETIHLLLFREWQLEAFAEMSINLPYHLEFLGKALGAKK